MHLRTWSLRGLVIDSMLRERHEAINRWYFSISKPIFEKSLELLLLPLLQKTRCDTCNLLKALRFQKDQLPPGVPTNSPQVLRITICGGEGPKVELIGEVFKGDWTLGGSWGVLSCCFFRGIFADVVAFCCRFFCFLMLMVIDG